MSFGCFTPIYVEINIHAVTDAVSWAEEEGPMQLAAIRKYDLGPVGKLATEQLKPREASISGGRSVEESSR